MTQKPAAIAALDSLETAAIEEQQRFRKREQDAREQKKIREQLTDVLSPGGALYEHISKIQAEIRYGDFGAWNSFLGELPDQLRQQHEAVICDVADALGGIATNYREAGLDTRWAAHHEAYTRQKLAANEKSHRQWNAAIKVVDEMMANGCVSREVVWGVVKSFYNTEVLKHVNTILADIWGDRLCPVTATESRTQDPTVTGTATSAKSARQDVVAQTTDRLPDGLHPPDTFVYQGRPAPVPEAAYPLLAYFVKHLDRLKTGVAETSLIESCYENTVESLNSHYHKANGVLKQVRHPFRLSRVNRGRENWLKAIPAEEAKSSRGGRAKKTSAE